MNGVGRIYYKAIKLNISQNYPRKNYIDLTPRKRRHSISSDQDRRASLAELQAEDMDRRPSITMYQSVDSQHPDVIAIQKLVDRMKFGFGETE